MREALILIGPPGSGKSSIANRLTENKNVTSIETGNLLRTEVEKATAVGKQIESDMSSGRIVSSNIVKDIILDTLSEKNERVILFDGFPRVPDQVEIFEEISDSKSLNIRKVVILQLEEDIIFKRLTGRRICEKCGTIYNIYFDKPEKHNECSKCGGKLIRRVDDSPDIVKDRLEFYNRNTLPVAEYFKNNYSDVTVELNADEDIDVLTAEIRRFIDENNLEV